MHQSNGGQSSSKTEHADHSHERTYMKTRRQSQNYLMKDNGLMRKSSTAEEQARAWVDWHLDTNADLAHMQWLVGAVAVEIVLYASNPSPLTSHQSRAHPDIEVRTPYPALYRSRNEFLNMTQITDQHSCTPNNLQTVSDLVVEQLRWMGVSFLERHASTSSRTSQYNAAGITY